MVWQVGVDGVIKLCEDLEVGEGPLPAHPRAVPVTSLTCVPPAEDVVMLVIAWLLKAAKMAEFTKVPRQPLSSPCCGIASCLCDTVTGLGSSLIRNLWLVMLVLVVDGGACVDIRYRHVCLSHCRKSG